MCSVDPVEDVCMLLLVASCLGLVNTSFEHARMEVERKVAKRKAKANSRKASRRESRKEIVEEFWKIWLRRQDRSEVL